jgi:hypothetical protein
LTAALLLLTAALLLLTAALLLLTAAAPARSTTTSASLHSAPAEKNQQSGKGKSHWQTMPSNSAAQSRPANFAKTEIHILLFGATMIFFTFFLKTNYCAFSYASVSCSIYSSGLDQFESKYFVGKEKSTLILFFWEDFQLNSCQFHVFSGGITGCANFSGFGLKIPVLKPLACFPS